MVKTPDLGVDSADVSELLIQVGDQVTEGQSLLVAESSKAAVEVPSTATGQVKAILVKTGQPIQVGQPLVELAIAGESTPAPASVSEAAKPAPQAAPAQNEQMPAQATKAESAPVPTSLSAPTQPAAAPVVVTESKPTDDRVYAGPAVRRLARQLGLALDQVSGSGDKGRLLKEDVYAYARGQLQATPVAAPVVAAAPSTPSGLPPLPDMSRYGASHDEPLSRLQQGAVQQLGLNTWIPQVTQFDQADITALEDWRNEIKAAYREQGVSVTILAFVAKAVAHLLKQETRFNSHLRDDGKTLLVRESVHLGIAVATPDGLIVPVLREPDTLGIKQIAEQLQDLSKKARDRKLTPADLAGASFTISSLGNLGGTGFTPLVNWPQVAILGLSPATMQPVWDGTAFVPRLMLPLSLSYDHRVINGADAARFTRRLAEMLSDIRSILL